MVWGEGDWEHFYMWASKNLIGHLEVWPMGISPIVETEQVKNK